MSQPLNLPRLESAPRIGLIIVGDEIMSGKRADKHLPKTIELLKARGLALDYADYVGDAPDRITSTLSRAFASGDLAMRGQGIRLRVGTAPPSRNPDPPANARCGFGAGRGL
jgi:hypothetical protein